MFFAISFGEPKEESSDDGTLPPTGISYLQAGSVFSREFAYVTSCAAQVRLDHTHSGLLKEARMCKFSSTRLWQLLAVKLTAAFSKSRTINALHVIEGLG